MHLCICGWLGLKVIFIGGTPGTHCLRMHVGNYFVGGIHSRVLSFTFNVNAKLVQTLGMRLHHRNVPNKVSLSFSPPTVSAVFLLH